MEIFSVEGLTSLATLIFLEIILGIDNVIFISIVANKLQPEMRSKAWRFGLMLALVIRVIMLFTISWLMNFSTPLFTLMDINFSLRDVILAGGGLFLVYKSTIEISQEFDDESEEDEAKVSKKNSSVFSVILQIVFIDFIFSFDSILTAVGLSNTIYIMIAAVLISMGIMMFFLGAIGDFIKRNPTIETLALSFLILIGFVLILEAFHYQIPKGYIYFAVAFSFTIELLNMRKKRLKKLKSKAVEVAQEPLDANYPIN